MNALRHRSVHVRFGSALLAVAIAAMLRAAFTPVWGAFDRPFILFFPAVVFAAWYGGLSAAVVSIIASVFVANIFFVDAELGFHPESFEQWTLILVFGLISFSIALLIEKMHRATTHAMHEADQRRRSETALRESEQKLRALAMKPWPQARPRITFSPFCHTSCELPSILCCCWRLNTPMTPRCLKKFAPRFKRSPKTSRWRRN